MSALEATKDYRDGDGLQFVKFDFMTGGSGIKIAILKEISIF